MTKRSRDFVLSGPVIIQTQNITNMCQAFRNLCLNGRCIPTPGVGYRCECNMGFRLDRRGECIGEFWRVFLTQNSRCMRLAVKFHACFPDDNECEKNPCAHGECVNTDGSYICQCPAGFQSTSTRTECRGYTFTYMQHMRTLRVCMFIVLSVSFFPARSGRVCGQWSYLQQWPLCEHWRQLPLCLQCWIWNFSRWQKLSRSVNFSCWSLTTLWSKDSFSVYDKWTMDMLEVVEAWTIMGEIMHNHWK